MKLNFYIVIIFIICIVTSTDAQIKDSLLLKDTIQTPISDQPRNTPSPFFPNADKTVFLDSIPLKPSQIKISSEALEEEVLYGSKDTSWTDIDNNQIHLFGEAFVEYTTIKVTARYIKFDFKNNTLEAYETIPDSLSGFAVNVDLSKEEKPTFIDGASTFTYKKLRYNFKSKKAFVDQAVTKESDFYLHGKQTKFVSTGADSTITEDIIYNKNAYITTCDADHPHFGIRASKLKFIPNKVAVMSLAQLEISDVPTPLFLPFGFFPLFKGKTSGLILPKSYDYQENLGLGFRGIGYYFPINQYIDARVTGDIYSRGSHGIRVNTRYKKRYGYSGTIDLGYTNNIFENNQTGGKTSSKSFNINIRHDQDSKAHPYRRIGGSINIQSNRFDQRTFVNPAAAITNTYTSNFSYSHSMPETPFSFNATFNHNQNTNTRKMTITFPQMTLRMNTINPFKSKSATKDHWYDKFALSYAADFRNSTTTTDTTLFTKETIDNLRAGLWQNASISTNIRVLKYFNVVPNATFDEYWLVNKFNLSFNPEEKFVFDTLRGANDEILGIVRRVTQYGKIDTLREQGFYGYRSFRTGVDINTKLFSTLQFRKGFLRGLRHQATPSISFVYTPMTTDIYQKMVDTDSRVDKNNPRTYGIYQESPFGSLRGTDAQMAVNYSLLNNFEAKIATKDTIRKVKLLNNIGVSGFYNAVADSLNWSDVRITGNTNFFKGMTNINLSLNLSPYVFNNTIKTNTTRYQVSKNIFDVLAYRDFNLGVNTSFSVQQITDLFSNKNEIQSSPKSSNSENKNPSQNGIKPNKNIETTDDNLAFAEWFKQLYFRHNFQLRVQNLGNRDTTIITTHTIDISGSIPLTKNWSVNIGSIGYDLNFKRLTYPYLTFNRDLHCWNMNFTWAPDAGTYGFFIGVKSGSLDFLKYNYGRQNLGGVLGGG
ncbi:MAG: putative LPS assembly protein LptD [Saprospiraceae bacterium]